MKRKSNHLKNYLLRNYSDTFFPIFLTLFVVTSIIYLVRISTLTSVMQISFLELLELYGYVVPTIIFYTLPISTFIGLALSLSKLSSEYELIVITSFGYNPLKLIKVFLPILTLTTLFLLLNTLVLIPKSDAKYNIFKEQKKVEAQFNIKASQYGQQFASWLIYVDEEKDGNLKDIVMYKKENNKDTFIISKYAVLKNDNSKLSLNLRDGKALNITDKINQIDFDKMTMSNYLKRLKNIRSLDDLVEYWKDAKADPIKSYKLSFSLFLSFFPLMSILFIIAMGYYNPRYDKNKTTLYAVTLTIVYIVMTQKLSEFYGPDALFFVPAVWLSFSIIYYRYKIKPYY